MIKNTVIYILKLNNNNFYVGTTSNLPRRLRDHFNHRGSVWTKKHKPLEVLDILENKDIFSEDNITKQLMFLHGFNHVRGGSYCRTELTPCDITTLTKEYRSAYNLCFKCGEPHMSYKCKKTK